MQMHNFFPIGFPKDEGAKSRFCHDQMRASDRSVDFGRRFCKIIFINHEDLNGNLV